MTAAISDDIASDLTDQAVSELNFTVGSKPLKPIKTFGRAVTTYNGKLTMKSAQSVKGRSVNDRHPGISPINTRRSEEEKLQARKRT